MIAKATFVLAFSVALAAMAGAGMADSKKSEKVKGNSAAKVHGTPPGLAKKPGGMPPGQYKKKYGYGDKLPRDYLWINDYSRWRLPPLAPGQGYVRYDNEVYRVVRDTAVVLEALGIVSDFLQ